MATRLQDYNESVKPVVLTLCRRLASNWCMKKATTMGRPKRAEAETFPPTSVRVDPDMLYRARGLALKNKRDGLEESTFSKVVNAALSDYLKKRSA